MNICVANSRIQRRPLFYAGLIALFLAGCNFPVRTAGQVIQPSHTAFAQDDDRPTVFRDSATDTPGASTQTDTEAPEETSTPTATIAHLTEPGNPGPVEWYVTDYSSKSTAAEKRAPGGENYQYNLFERPFLAADMQYLPGVDILRADMMKSGGWFYVTIRLQEEPTADEKASARYGAEVDVDIDGRGEYLIWAAAPGGTEWTTDEVQVWTDKNNDVGGPVPVKSDMPGTRDGYEELSFDQGRGVDPDAAWARFSPEDPKRVQVAFKLATIANDIEFLWGVWADAGVKQPGWFDYDDHFTTAEAGSPLSNKAEYPLKALAALDNTCRMSYGFTLLGTEPGACYMPVPTTTPTLTPTSTPTSPAEIVFRVTSVEVYGLVIQRNDAGCMNYAIVDVRVTTNKAGTVTYTWEIQYDGGAYTPSGSAHTDPVAGAGTHTLGSLGITVVPPHSYKIRVHVSAPNDIYSNEVAINATCS